MGKKVIITAGPTNERIDSVRKITNMATGSFGKVMAEELWRPGIDTIYYLSPKLAAKPSVASSTRQIKCIEIESAEDLLAELTKLLTTEHIDAVIHSAAVGDYKAKYSIRAEDPVSEIVERQAEEGRMLDYDELMEIFDSPRTVNDDSGKMSSYEPHLMTMMTLTPKVIGHIKKLSPDTVLVGFKLLDGVPKEELLRVARNLQMKNDADYIVANDLSLMKDGRYQATVIGKYGFEFDCSSKKELAQVIRHRLEERW